MTKNQWVSVSQMFGCDGSSFQVGDLPTNVYNSVIEKYSEKEVGQALEHLLMDRYGKWFTPKELKAALSGHSKNDRERATMDAMGIWRAIEGIGANGRIDAKMRLNKAQWEAVEKMGTWKSLCDRLTNADKPTFIAQARDMIMDIYTRIENEEKRQQLQLEQKKNDQNLIGE